MNDKAALKQIEMSLSMWIFALPQPTVYDSSLSATDVFVK